MLRVSKALFTICFSFIGINTCAQDCKMLKEVPINLSHDLTSPSYEYSGLAKWEDKVLLIPQFPNKVTGIPILDSSDLNASIVSNKNTPEIKRSQVIALSDTYLMDSLKQKVGSNSYGGIEAAVVVGNTVFFTIETDLDSCYIIKGTIHKLLPEKYVLQWSKKCIAIPKPNNKHPNAGFESIAYLQGKLIAFFEQNRYPDESSAYLIDTSLEIQKIDPVKFQSPLLFRLTDIAIGDSTDNTFWGLNHYYNDYREGRKDFCHYIGQENYEKAKKLMSGKSPYNSHFTQIVKLKLKESKLTQVEKGETIISFCIDNWEGILPFKDGILLIVDGKPPSKGVPCRLAYFEFR